MSKQHECEWYMCANPAGEIYAMCRDIRCHGKVLKRDEIESRLNATERLSAEDARELAHEIKRHDYASIAEVWRYKGSGILHDSVVAYADIREGKR